MIWEEDSEIRCLPASTDSADLIFHAGEPSSKFEITFEH